MRVLCILCLIHLGINFHALGDSKATCIVVESRKILGIRETPGTNNRGPEVDALIRAVGGKIGTPWCGWTAKYVHQKCGCASSGGMAMSWFVPSRVIKSGWVPGDVFSIWNKYLGRIGHTGMVEQVLPSGNFIVTIEGNTNGAGSREGSGVFRLTRPLKQIYSFARWWASPKPQPK